MIFPPQLLKNKTKKMMMKTANNFRTVIRNDIYIYTNIKKKNKKKLKKNRAENEKKKEKKHRQK